MKILSEQKRSTQLSDDVIYKFDSLFDAQNLMEMFRLIFEHGYTLKRYVLNFVQDHVSLNSSLSGNSDLELFNILNNCDFEELESIDLVISHKEIEIYGTVYPDANIFRISFPKKNNNVNYKRI